MPALRAFYSLSIDDEFLEQTEVWLLVPRSVQLQNLRKKKFYIWSRKVAFMPLEAM